MNNNELINTLADESVAYEWAEKLAAGMRRSLPDAQVEVRECVDSNVERIAKELDKLTKLSLRYGQPAPRVHFSPTRFVVTRVKAERDPETGEPVERKYKVICRAMVVVAPTYLGQDGWTLVARVTLLNGQRIVATFPGQTAPAEYYQDATANGCDHCGMVRRRNELIVVRRERQDGAAGFIEFKQLGKDCLKEYCGIDPVHALAVAGFYEATGEVNGTERYEENLDDYLAWVARRVRIDGRYWSRDKANEENERRYREVGNPFAAGYRVILQVPTAEQAGRDEFAAQQATEQEGRRDPIYYPTDADRAMVQTVKSWALTLDTHQSTYHANLVALVRADALVWGLKGLAASIFAGYAREQAFLAKAREQAAAPVSHFLGVQGDKVDLPRVKVTLIREFEGTFGMTHIYKFVTPEGNVATWFSSNDCELTVGQELRLRGTVKKLETYQGQEQTTLTRCRILPL